MSLYGMIKDNKSSVSGGMTRVNVNKFRYTWLIDNFEYWIDDEHPDTFLESPKFSTQHGEVKINWNLAIFLHRKVEVLVEICLKPESNMHNAMHFEVFFLNKDGEEVAKQRATYPAKNETKKYGEYWIEEYVKRDFIIDKSNKLLDRGVLTIVCTIIFVGKESYHAGQTRPRASIPISRECRLGQLDEYERLLFSKTFSDFTLVAGGEELPVHKSILAIKSPVFAAMLEHDTADTREARVEIVDIEPNVLREMLRFVYVGKVNNFEELAPRLLAAAEKYNLEVLKTLCEEEIIEYMALDNVHELLLISDKYNASKLKAAAIKFITNNFKQLSKSEKFQRVKNAVSPSLKTEMMIAFMKL